MKCYKLGVDCDIKHLYTDAIDYYQESIVKKEMEINAYLNLAFIYWAAASELNWSIAENIPKEIRQTGYKKSFIILELAEAIWENIEIKFWKEWFVKETILEYLDEKETLAILKENPNQSLVPYFNLIICNPDNLEYRKQGYILYENCKKEVTAKNRYILTFIESKFRN